MIVTDTYFYHAINVKYIFVNFLPQNDTKFAIDYITYHSSILHGVVKLTYFHENMAH